MEEGYTMIFSRILQTLRKMPRRRAGLLALTLLVCAMTLLTFTAAGIVNAQGQEKVTAPAHTNLVIPAWKKKKKEEQKKAKGVEITPTAVPIPPTPIPPMPTPVIPAPPKLPPTGSDPGSNPLP
jgi:hypothetical protein